jgi:hypothetical protein
LSLLRSNRMVSKTSMSLVQFWTIEWHIMGMSFHVCSRFSVLFGFEFLWLFFVQKRETLWHYLQTLKKKNLMDLLTLTPWVLALFFLITMRPFERTSGGVHVLQFDWINVSPWVKALSQTSCARGPHTH